ncbi:MAG: hypothetical protein JNJ69_12550 [Leptospiraceae bacterium]|nr:hypothetical protein [Leptospiraceae bacterium]
MRKLDKWISVVSISLCFTNACVNDDVSPAPVQSASFKLADGSPISEAAYDDYNPILLQLSNGYLALVYASTRTCAISCSGHNIFIASSVTTYAGDGKLPAFNAPQVVTGNSSPLNYSSRLRLAAISSGTNINVFAKSSSGSIEYSGMISPVSAVPINVGAFMSSVITSICSTQALLGMDASNMMITSAGASGPISRFDWNMSTPPCPTNTFANTSIGSAINISYVRAADIGISEGFLVADSAGRLSAHTATSSGPVIQNFTDAMTRNSLYMTSATVFKANAAAGDLLVFSAAPSAGANSDMYIIVNKTPSALWLKYTPFGTQPKP